MPARGGGDLDRRPSRGFEPGTRPCLETARVIPEALGTGGGGDDGARRGQELPTGGVQVVVVVVVAEQHRVDRSEVPGGYRGPGQLARPRAPAEPVALTRRVER